MSFGMGLPSSPQPLKNLLDTYSHIINGGMVIGHILLLVIARRLCRVGGVNPRSSYPATGAKCLL